MKNAQPPVKEYKCPCGHTFTRMVKPKTVVHCTKCGKRVYRDDE